MASLIKKIAKLNPVTISIFAIFIGIFAYLKGIPFLDLMELKTIDLRFISREKVAAGSDIVLAVIDEKSLDKEGKWIWPRSKLADLVTKLSDSGAKVITFDIGFIEPDDKQIIQTIEDIQAAIKNISPQDEKYLEKLKANADNDKLLADAISCSNAKIVLGYFFQMDSEKTGHIDRKKRSAHQKNIGGSQYKVTRYSSGNAQNIPLVEAKTPKSNIALLSNAADYCGFFNMFPDKDGVVRWIPAVIRFDEMLYAPLSVVTAGAFLGSPLSIQIADYGVEKIQINGLSIPSDELGRVIINYRGDAKTLPHISITDILNKTVPDSVFKEKIVIVGATAVGIYDMRVTPFSNVFPGLEIHANIIDSILSEDFLYKPNWAAFFDIAAIIITGLFLGVILPRTGVIFGAASVFVIFSGYILLCWRLFSENGLVLNLVYPLAVVIIVYVGITAYKYLVETRQKKFIKNAFSTYLAPTVVKQLIESPENLELGGEEREITAFFSDVQGFTSISESLAPAELVELLNEFLTEMTDIILNCKGTVDKFEGDAIIAFFGAPNTLENHAKTACLASMKMQKRLSELRNIWRTKNKPELMMRIGLCSGPAVVGNMGSKNRMDYTMMGDTVNIAARLEGVNKVYGTYTLIGETTCNAAGNGIVTRQIDTINVVGKKEPLNIYQPLGYPEEIENSTIDTISLYSKGLYAYRAQDWDKAIKLFKSALNIRPDDGPSKTMLGRCGEFILNPPGKDWNGSFTMKTK